MIVRTNLPLAEGQTEIYHSREAMEEGSALAQVLAAVDGILTMEINRRELTITRDPSVPWHAIMADVHTALKEFFL
jgi:hypothetical protein